MMIFLHLTKTEFQEGVSYLRMHSDMEAEIHHLEQEAYYSVLRAFKAQSNAITWVFTFLCSHILY